jgi:hypothetical protein
MTTDINAVVPTELETIAYLNSLPPRIHPRALSTRSAAEDKSDSIAEISKKSPVMVAFADGVSKKNRDAVLLGVEFGEAVANSKSNVESDPVQWLREYTEALRHAGWLTLGGSEYGEYTTSNKSLTMDSIVMELVSSIAGPNATTVLALMNFALDRLQKTDSLMKLFERNAKSGNTSSFRVVPCIESSEGIPMTYLVSVHANYHTDAGGALFWKWSISKMSVKRLAKGVQFSQASFERNKDKINAYMGAEADDFFESLKKK